MSPYSNRRLLLLAVTSLLVTAVTGESEETQSTVAGPIQEHTAATVLADPDQQHPTTIAATSGQKPKGIDQELEEAGRAGRKLKRLRRIAVPLLLVLLLVKSGLGMPLLMGGVALAAFKGLWTGTTALMVTAALALRHLLPAPRVIIAGGGGGGGHHHHYADYVTDYRRADDYRDDYNRYNGYGW